MDWLEMFLSCDCLGCVNDALASGLMSQADYDEYFEQIKAEQRQQYGVCPSCGNAHAYISQYEPSMMHCDECGTYSGRPEFSDSDEWTPYARGIVTGKRSTDADKG